MSNNVSSENKPRRRVNNPYAPWPSAKSTNVSTGGTKVTTGVDPKDPRHTSDEPALWIAQGFSVLPLDAPPRPTVPERWSDDKEGDGEEWDEEIAEEINSEERGEEELDEQDEEVEEGEEEKEEEHEVNQDSDSDSDSDSPSPPPCVDLCGAARSASSQYPSEQFESLRNSPLPTSSFILTPLPDSPRSHSPPCPVPVVRPELPLRRRRKLFGGDATSSCSSNNNNNNNIHVISATSAASSSSSASSSACPVSVDLKKLQHQKRHQQLLQQQQPLQSEKVKIQDEVVLGGAGGETSDGDETSGDEGSAGGSGSLFTNNNNNNNVFTNFTISSQEEESQNNSSSRFTHQQRHQPQQQQQLLHNQRLHQQQVNGFVVHQGTTRLTQQQIAEQRLIAEVQNHHYSQNQLSAIMPPHRSRNQQQRQVQQHSQVQPALDFSHQRSQEPARAHQRSQEPARAHQRSQEPARASTARVSSRRISVFTTGTRQNSSNMRGSLDHWAAHARSKSQTDGTAINIFLSCTGKHCDGKGSCLAALKDAHQLVDQGAYVAINTWCACHEHVTGLPRYSCRSCRDVDPDESTVSSNGGRRQTRRCSSCGSQRQPPILRSRAASLRAQPAALLQIIFLICSGASASTVTRSARECGIGVTLLRSIYRLVGRAAVVLTTQEKKKDAGTYGNAAFDEAYNRTRRNSSRPTDASRHDKKAVIGVAVNVDRPTNTISRLHMNVLPDAKKETLRAAFAHLLSFGGDLQTDGHKSYENFADERAVSQTFNNHSVNQWVAGHNQRTSNPVESAISMFRRSYDSMFGNASVVGFDNFEERVALINYIFNSKTSGESLVSRSIRLFRFIVDENVEHEGEREASEAIAEDAEGLLELQEKYPKMISGVRERNSGVAMQNAALGRQGLLSTRRATKTIEKRRRARRQESSYSSSSSSSCSSSSSSSDSNENCILPMSAKQRISCLQSKRRLEIREEKKLNKKSKKKEDLKKKENIVAPPSAAAASAAFSSSSRQQQQQQPSAAAASAAFSSFSRQQQQQQQPSAAAASAAFSSFSRQQQQQQQQQQDSASPSSSPSTPLADCGICGRCEDLHPAGQTHIECVRCKQWFCGPCHQLSPQQLIQATNLGYTCWRCSGDEPPQPPKSNKKKKKVSEEELRAARSHSRFSLRSVSKNKKREESEKEEEDVKKKEKKEKKDNKRKKNTHDETSDDGGG